MNESLEHPFNAILILWVVRGMSQSSLCGFLSARRLLNIQHIEFRSNVCAIRQWPDGEFGQPRFKLQNGVCDNQVTADAVTTWHLPIQQAKRKNEFIFFTKPELLLMDRKEL
jgi:hypothetical protein